MPILFPNIRPEIFSLDIFGFEFALRWYAMGYILGIFLGWKLIVRALNRPSIWQGDAPMRAEQLEDLLTYIVVGVIAGGRIGYVFFYNFDYYAQYPSEIIQIWTGGLSFHGGFLGVIFGVWLFSKRYNVPLSPLADIIALSATPAIFLVRIANFINAELWGRASDVPWAVAFPGEAAQSCGQLVGLCGRHPSQLYEATLEGLLLGSLLYILAFYKGGLKTPWRLSGVFFLGYGLARFLVEFVRQPDAQFVEVANPLGLAYHIDGYGVTMGQTLTLPMIVVGTYLILRSQTRHTRYEARNE